ncbi:MAG: Alkyl hydroperoxide reductase C [Candidatus Marinimicrobia bacterium]|nr:Alkyl hydroperoxide reductase C [Candidatus Neomarinimicrobiota bacterium]
MSLQIGQKAPTFEVEAVTQNGEFETVSLSDYQGKWTVLFFYPLDFTFVCPTEIQGFNKHYEQFQELNAEILGASTDSLYSHKVWTEDGLGKLKFPLISDYTKELSRDYGVLVPEKGFALRGTFIIDPEGVLRSVVVNDESVGRSVDETLRTLQALQTGKNTPCEWAPGEATL